MPASVTDHTVTRRSKRILWYASDSRATILFGFAIAFRCRYARSLFHARDSFRRYAEDGIQQLVAYVTDQPTMTFSSDGIRMTLMICFSFLASRMSKVPLIHDQVLELF